MAKDALGNQLHEGDLVQMKLDESFVIGRIAHIHEGASGLVSTPGSKPQPGMLSVELEVASVFVPGKPIGAVIRVIDPERNQPKNNSPEVSTTANA